jgi:mitogen-activated protein kinase 1/3
MSEPTKGKSDGGKSEIKMGASSGDKKGGTDKKYPGRHKFRVNACEFDVDRKYFPVKVLGEGAYGVVCLAEDREDPKSRQVAIKKCSKAFHDLVDAKRILREIKLLRHFDHQNIVSVRDLIPPRSLGYIEDVYIVMDSMEANLHKIIYSRQKLSNEHIQYFIYQVLKGLKYLHSAGVLHRDLKPSNLLVNHNCDLKICDFGLARGMSETADSQYTEYVVTRHYRAPEVMTNAKKYDEQIDVWSVGCIFAELLGRKALFPGQDYLEQLRLIIQKVGQPSREDLDLIPTPAARSYIEGLGPCKKANWRELFPLATPLACDLLDQMLQFNSRKRITVDQALKHEYFKSLYKESQIIECKTPFKFDWEKTELDEARIQDLMWEEIYQFRGYLKEEREKRLRDGSIPDFKTLKAQQVKLSSAQTKTSTQPTVGDGRSRGASKGGEKTSVISEPIADEPEVGPGKK